MPPQPILDPSHIDLSQCIYDQEAIRGRLPQRYEMEMLDRIVHFDVPAGLCAAVKEVRGDEFWARGHFPGRPVLPGVLIIEAAGQLCSFFFGVANASTNTLGFAAIDHASFRGVIQPPDKLLLVAKRLSMKARSAQFLCQAFVGTSLVFEGQILGMPI